MGMCWDQVHVAPRARATLLRLLLLGFLAHDPCLQFVTCVHLSHKNLCFMLFLFGFSEGTVYAGGIFHVQLDFPKTYPNQPPSATLLTPLPHPHVIKGKICLDLL